MSSASELLQAEGQVVGPAELREGQELVVLEDDADAEDTS
jgi:hypothetical protein